MGTGNFLPFNFNRLMIDEYPILDILAAPKAYAQMHQPVWHDVQPVLCPSSTESVMLSTLTWFLTMFFFFILSSILLGASIFLATILGPNLLQECFILVKASLLGATIIAAYFMVLLVVWGEFWC
jgi:hypothetical protein